MGEKCVIAVENSFAFFVDLATAFEYCPVYLGIAEGSGERYGGENEELGVYLVPNLTGKI